MIKNKKVFLLIIISSFIFIGSTLPIMIDASSNFNSDYLAGINKSDHKRSDIRVFAQVDLDYLYDKNDSTVLENNIKKLIERFKRDEVTDVFLQAFCDKEGNGDINSVYFYTNNAPVEADIFAKATKLIQNEGYKVHAWMPTLACQWLFAGDINNKVVAYKKKYAGWYNRATPFSLDVKYKLAYLLLDLVKNSSIDGILFQDDLYLNDYEDFSSYGKAAFKEKFKIDLTNKIFSNQKLMDNWTDFKAKTINNLTISLMKLVLLIKPQIKFYRNIYDACILEDYAKEYLAQDLNDFLAIYDGVLVMAYPYMVKASNPTKWIDDILSKTFKMSKGNHEKVIMKFQTVIWDDDEDIPISSKIINSWIEKTKKQGFINYAMYPYQEKQE